MKYLKKRPRLDKLVNQQRAKTGAWGRRIYILLLVLLGLALGNYFFGDSVLLRADGTVWAERHVVAATYPAKVTDVRIREGDRISRGAVLLQLESADMLKDIADLAIRTAELAVRETQLRVKIATVSALLPLADRHARETAGTVD